MKTISKKPTTVAEYIANFPTPVQKNLKKLRAIIKKAAPDATEKLGYGIPGYNYQGMLVYFAGYKRAYQFLCDAFSYC